MTMLLGPPTATLTDVLLRRFAKAEEREPDNFDDAHGSVLVIGFGRFGQIVSQCLLARDVDVTILDNSAQMIQNGARFGFKVYYGDGTRLDVLRAAGIGRVQLVAICVDTPQAADRIVDLVRIDCPEVGLYVRSYDRIHSLRLIAKGVNFELRETFESALVFGQKALEALDVNPEEAREIAEDVRRRDQERLALQMAEGLEGGIDLMHPRPVVPEPLNVPHSHAKPLNPEAEDILHHETEFSG
jgi:voltage-gated potassium channel Kch